MLTADNAYDSGLMTAGAAISADISGAKQETWVPFEDIGPGKPLTIMIREIYTGKYPEKGFFDTGKKQMIVTSAVKSFCTYDAQPHALNLMSKITYPYKRLTGPSSTESGTPIIFYTPALVEDDFSLKLGLYIAFDDFKQEIFECVGNTCQGAASIPIFLPYSVYLLAAGAIIKIVGKIGEDWIDSDPEFAGSEDLHIHSPGVELTHKGYRIITDNKLGDLDEEFRTEYSVDQKTGQVIDKSGKPYKGDIPYAVISLDGHENKKLKDFAPTAASAALISKFFKVQDSGSLHTDELIEAFKVYNDYKYLQAIDQLDKEIDDLPEGPGKIKKISEREAFKKNILTDLFKKSK